jgi:hypothetical protein
MTRKLPERAIIVQAYLTLSRSATWMSSGFRLDKKALWAKGLCEVSLALPADVALP